MSVRRAGPTAAQRKGAGNKRTLALLLHAAFPAYEVAEEFRFHEVRKWRFDYAIPALKIAVEYQGHGSTGAIKGGHVGGHGSISGISKDAEKMNAAQAAGWRVLLFTALHFDATARRKHKLSHPQDAIRALCKTPPTE